MGSLKPLICRHTWVTARKVTASDPITSQNTSESKKARTHGPLNTLMKMHPTYLMIFWRMLLKGVFHCNFVSDNSIYSLIHSLFIHSFIHSFVLQLFISYVFHLPEVGKLSLALNTPLCTAIVFIAHCSFLAVKTPSQCRLSPPSFSKVKIGSWTYIQV